MQNNYAKPIGTVKGRKFRKPNQIVQNIVNQLEEKQFCIQLQNQQVFNRRAIWKNGAAEGIYGGLNQ